MASLLMQQNSYSVLTLTYFSAHFPLFVFFIHIYLSRILSYWRILFKNVNKK